MVNGPSPGPVPAATASSSWLTRSNCRTWPQRKLRRKVPRVDGALTTQPSTRPVPLETQHLGVADAVAASQCRGHQGQQLVAGVRSARGISQVNVSVYQFTQPQAQGRGGG